MRAHQIISQELKLYLMNLLAKENNLKFEYVGTNEDIRIYEYMDSKDFFNAIRDNKIGFSETKNKQNDFLNKLTNIKIGRKTLEQEK